MPRGWPRAHLDRSGTERFDDSERGYGKGHGKEPIFNVLGGVHEEGATRGGKVHYSTFAHQSELRDRPRGLRVDHCRVHFRGGPSRRARIGCRSDAHLDVLEVFLSRVRAGAKVATHFPSEGEIPHKVLKKAPKTLLSGDVGQGVLAGNRAFIHAIQIRQPTLARRKTQTQRPGGATYTVLSATSLLCDAAPAPTACRSVPCCPPVRSSATSPLPLQPADLSAHTDRVSSRRHTHRLPSRSDSTRVLTAAPAACRS